MIGAWSRSYGLFSIGSGCILTFRTLLYVVLSVLLLSLAYFCSRAEFSGAVSSRSPEGNPPALLDCFGAFRRPLWQYMYNIGDNDDHCGTPASVRILSEIMSMNLSPTILYLRNISIDLTRYIILRFMLCIKRWWWTLLNVHPLRP